MPGKSTNQNIPPGFKLNHTLLSLEGKFNQFAWSPDGQKLALSSEDNILRIWDMISGRQSHSLLSSPPLFQGNWKINQLAWSPDGQILASASNDKGILLWDRETRKQLHNSPKGSWMRSVAWSPDGQMLASGSDDRIIRLWNRETAQTIQSLHGHSGVVRSVAWSPDGQMLASGSDDCTVRLWDVNTGNLLCILTGHASVVNSVAWSFDGQLLASGSSDQTIRLWNPKTRRQMDILEGHTDFVIRVSFSPFSQLLASKAHDDTVRIWHPDTWETVAVISTSSSNRWNPGLAFHPTLSSLTILGEDDTAVHFWNLDLGIILSTSSVTPSAHYTNAKVVLVGDTGVGKTGLGLVLANQSFIPTESTHGRYIWTFESREVRRGNRLKKTYETLLWDLAGQAGYRLIHQLHLNEVAVALVLFDARSEIEPFSGVFYWNRALRLAQRVQGISALPMIKFLVAARIDRGGKSVSQDRIKALVNELGFDAFFETSAKEGWGIAELAEAIKKAIDWEALPRVRSTALFQSIKAFLIAEKVAGRVLTITDDLYSAFLKTEKGLSRTEGLRVQFETCIGLVEARGLIRRLSFGNLVLLQPEMLDAYASALINAVQDEPDGLGSIAEERVRMANFLLPVDERLKNREQEKLLLIAMVEDMLRHEIALREDSFLVFPAQSTRETSNLPAPEGKKVIFRFEGPVLNIYATLVVRLSHSDVFRKKEIWKNAVIYTTKKYRGGTYGILLQNTGEGYGELTLFLNESASEEVFFVFEEYVYTHLQRRALPESIQRLRLFVCSNRECRTPFTEAQVTRRKQAGFDWIRCNVCDTSVSLLNKEEPSIEVSQSLILKMDRAADIQREKAVNTSVLQGVKVIIESGNFQVFLCHNSEDKPEVKRIAEQLKDRGIAPWLDEWELRPGLPWQETLEQHIGRIKSAAVFVGRGGIGPWQQQELEAFLRQFVKRRCPVIPVLLEEAPNEPELPIFLAGMTWVDFRKLTPDPLEHLIWGITGEHSSFC